MFFMYDSGEEGYSADQMAWIQYGGGDNTDLADLTSVKAKILDYKEMTTTRAFHLYIDISSQTLKLALINRTTGAVLDTEDIGLDAPYAAIDRLSDTALILVYGDHTAQAGQCHVVTFPADTININDGTKDQFINGTTAPHSVDVSAIDSTSAIITFSDTDDDNSGQVSLAQFGSNILPYSQDLDDPGWAPKTEVTISANGANDSAGESTLDKVVETTANNLHLVRETINIGAGTFTCTAEMRAGERDLVMMLCRDNGAGAHRSVLFDLTNGTATVYGTGLAGSESIEDLGGGLYRCSVTYTQTVGGATSYVDFRLADSTTGMTNSGKTYVGDNTKGVYIGRCQLEESSSTGPYVKTTGTAATSGEGVYCFPKQEFTANHCMWNQGVYAGDSDSSPRVVVSYTDVDDYASLKSRCGTINTGTGAITWGTESVINQNFIGNKGNRKSSLCRSGDDSVFLGWLDEDTAHSVTFYTVSHTLGAKPRGIHLSLDGTTINKGSVKNLDDAWWHSISVTQVDDSNLILVAGSKDGLSESDHYFTMNTPGVLLTVSSASSISVLNDEPFHASSHMAVIDSLSSTSVSIAHLDINDGVVAKIIDIDSGTTAFSFPTLTDDVTVDTGTAVGGTNYHTLAAAIVALNGTGGTIGVYEETLSEDINIGSDGADADNPIRIVARHANGLTLDSSTYTSAAVFAGSFDRYFSWVGVKFVANNNYAVNIGGVSTNDDWEFIHCVAVPDASKTHFSSNILGAGVRGRIISCISSGSEEHSWYGNNVDTFVFGLVAYSNDVGGFRHYGDRLIFWSSILRNNDFGLGLQSNSGGDMNDFRIEDNVFSNNYVGDETSQRNIHFSDGDDTGTDLTCKDATCLDNLMTNPAAAVANIDRDSNSTYAHTFLAATDDLLFHANAAHGGASNISSP